MTSIIRRLLLTILLVFSTLGLSVLPSCAFCKVLSIPGQPYFISVEQDKYDKGRIAKAYFRTTDGIYMLYELEGLKYVESEFSLADSDYDGLQDVVWTITMEDPDNGRRYFIWIVTLSSIKRGWIFSTPTGETRWETLPVDIKTPMNVLVYYSPTTPRYRDIPQYYGKGVFTFVYTIAITPDGPALASVPEVYDSLSKISQLFIANEADSTLKFVYENIHNDYDRMKEGKTPSKEAILNFDWKRILNFGWK